MSARSGMTALIDELRGLTQAGTADWTLGTAIFFDDDHVQGQLDRNRVDFYRLPLVAIPETQAALGDATGNGTVVYKKYQVPYRNLETIASGTAIFALTYANGGTVSQAFTVDYARGLIEFTNNQAGTAFYLTARAFDLFQTAADIWDIKASYYAQAYDVETGDKALKRSQIVKQCKEQAAHFRNQGGPNVISIERDDTR